MPSPLREIAKRLMPASALSGLKKLHADYESRYPITRPSSAAGAERRHALVSYITAPFTIGPDDVRNTYFSNIGIARGIVAALNDMGYDVDIIEWSNDLFTPRKKYDLFFGHAGRNFERLATLLPPEAPRIYFSTGIYWRDWNAHEEARFQRIEETRGVRLPYDRWITESEEGANAAADGIICLGNQVAKDSYSKFPLVVNVNNATYFDDHYDTTKKDFEAARRNFFFFSSVGNVHKGLDLLLEAFTGLDAHLYVWQGASPEFHELYRKELETLPNIHWLGAGPTRSPKFYEMVDQCGYVIHASCAEGQPGSVLDAMHQGLVPVLSRENNLDVGDYGVMLEDCSVAHIAEIVQSLSERSAEWLETQSRRTREIALRDYSEEAFQRNIAAAIQTVITESRKGK
ncbi:hypothetical protein CCAX7_24120 [Capsulimonas corticalis]|uniref:Uncharacterized protein n=1 Tax=Capsulimonas corticalis TaxID=2219043 RepID=A0A402CV99_9BACT|nr:glycosyltransferase [Capsulimonas corticalis]BDI30361.1 hypothetical protein CCAX7_24120 [Capsulimonas corticalis]